MNADVHKRTEMSHVGNDSIQSHPDLQITHFVHVLAEFHGLKFLPRISARGSKLGQDITQGLPRVEEIFEARKPKGMAIISEYTGTVVINETNKKREVIISNEDGDSKPYLIPYDSKLIVMDGDSIEAGDKITKSLLK